MRSTDMDCAFVLEAHDREQRLLRGGFGMAGDAADGRVPFEGQFADIDALRATAERGPESAPFADRPVPTEGHRCRFSKDRLTNWRTGPPALADS